jgi:hypothetical protein
MADVKISEMDAIPSPFSLAQQWIIIGSIDDVSMEKKAYGVKKT